MGVVRQLTALGEMKGRQDLYRAQQPEVLETLRQVAVILSTESSNRLEQVVIAPSRLRELMARRAVPQNRLESEVAGYRDVLETIHSSWAYMRLSPNLILQMHRDLYRYTPQPGGHWKQADNQIAERWPDGTVRIRFGETTPAHLTGIAMDALCSAFLRLREEGTVDDLVLVAAFVLDFLCIHPFTDGNGRMARLLTLLLLYQAGYQVGRYISLERVIEESKETYYDSLYRSSQGWAQGRNDLLPWLTYFLGVLQAAYRDLDDRVREAGKAAGSKGHQVRAAVEQLDQPFSVRDILAACPNVSPAMVRKVLDELRNEGRVVLLGRGRNARWVRKDMPRVEEGAGR